MQDSLPAYAQAFLDRRKDIRMEKNSNRQSNESINVQNKENDKINNFAQKQLPEKEVSAEKNQEHNEEHDTKKDSRSYFLSDYDDELNELLEQLDALREENRTLKLKNKELQIKLDESPTNEELESLRQQLYKTEDELQSVKASLAICKDQMNYLQHDNNIKAQQLLANQTILKNINFCRQTSPLTSVSQQSDDVRVVRDSLDPKQTTYLASEPTDIDKQQKYSSDKAVKPSKEHTSVNINYQQDHCDLNPPVEQLKTESYGEDDFCSLPAAEIKRRIDELLPKQKELHEVADKIPLNMQTKRNAYEQEIIRVGRQISRLRLALRIKDGLCKQ